jgi:hypothetical protein
LAAAAGCSTDEWKRSDGIAVEVAAVCRSWSTLIRGCKYAAWQPLDGSKLSGLPVRVKAPENTHET